MCCGNKRTALARSGNVDDPQGQSSTCKLLYLKNIPVTVRGPITGKSYYFSEHQRSQRVDARDLAGLLRTNLFCQRW